MERNSMPERKSWENEVKKKISKTKSQKGEKLTVLKTKYPIFGLKLIACVNGVSNGSMVSPKRKSNKHVRTKWFAHFLINHSDQLTQTNQSFMHRRGGSTGHTYAMHRIHVCVDLILHQADESFSSSWAKKSTLKLQQGTHCYACVCVGGCLCVWNITPPSKHPHTHGRWWTRKHRHKVNWGYFDDVQIQFKQAKLIEVNSNDEFWFIFY